MKLVSALLFAAAVGLSPVAAFAGQVNINAADAKTLEKDLVGIGPKAAKAIVDYRAKNGPFKSVEDLEKVKGIGPKLVEKNRANLTVK